MDAPRRTPSREPTIESMRSNSIASQSTTRSDPKRDGSGSRPSRGGPAVESAVTRLLVAIKQLLEALTLWSKLEMTEGQVSDVYVRLGNDFNAAVAAFAAFNIDMSELLSVPDDLRGVLEQCLSEDATPVNLEQYLPKVREIITSLLQGLRGKQSIYRKTVAERQTTGTERSSTRSSTSRSRTGDSVRSSASSAETSRSSSSARRKESLARKALAGSDAEGGSGGRFVGGFAAPAGLPSGPRDSVAFGGRRQPSGTRPRPGADETDEERTPPRRAPSNAASPRGAPQDLTPPSQPVPPVPTVAPEVKRYSLIDGPTPAPPTPSVTVDASSPDPDAQYLSVNRATSPAPPDTPVTPGMESSLAALKRSDALERRASKRFSTYTFSKMAGTPTRDKALGGNQGSILRKSMAAATNLTNGDLHALTEADETPTTPSKSRVRKEMTRQKSSDSISRRTKPAPLDLNGLAPPLPPIPSAQRTAEGDNALTPVQNQATLTAKSEIDPTTPTRRTNPPAPERPTSDSSTGSLTVFLQVGRQVKKVFIESGISFSTLRVLFVDKFAYNPGTDNFPAIYIRDPSSGVQYELEDVDEVKDKCLLSLNIEPLDQIKQHIDMQMDHLAKDIKELKSAVSSSRRMSFPGVVQAVAPNLAAITSPVAPRPSDQQFQNAAKQVMKMKPLVPQLTGNAEFSGTSTRIVNDLKTQFDEVQNLRRDLGIMRQLYIDFVANTKESITALKTQTQAVKQVSEGKIGGARAYIDSGKSKLDSRSQNILTRVEELQDTVETLKDDVLKRHTTPMPAVMRQLKASIAESAKELEDLTEHIKTIKPMWKKTWSEELQNIVEEQGFLSHQEEFLEDLLEDHKAVTEVYGHVEKVITLRKSSRSQGLRSRAFKLPTEEGHTGLPTVLMEIRGAAIDPERRMKAIEANQKARMKELDNRSDEFQQELSGFVSGKRLKMTGGAEEADRVRQKKNENTLKAMFSPQTTPAATPMLTAQVTGSSVATTQEPSS